MSKVGVLLKFTARLGEREALVAHLSETALLADSEVGTELWVVHTSPTEPQVVWVYEVYANNEAKHIHETSEGYVKARTKTGELLAAPPEAFPLTPIGGKGLGRTA